MPPAAQRGEIRTPAQTKRSAGPQRVPVAGPYTRAYRGACLPSFMVIGSQKAATSKLRWYLSRHPSIDIPKEEAFHGGPNAVAAWDTAADPKMLSSYLDAFEDICNSTTRVTGLKMPDYIVMSEKTIALFHQANPMMRIIVTLREPVARMYSYFSMQLRFGWSPINHMGKNPCMQRRLRELLAAKQRARKVEAWRQRLEVKFSSEDIMMTNFECVRPCYANNASGIGAAAEAEIWHDEARHECRNIYFTPLVHSMYALHLRRWLKTFPRESVLLLRFDDIVIRPIDALQRVASFLSLPAFPNGFKVEYGRENYTTIARLLKSGAMTPQSLQALETFFAPHDAMLRSMFAGNPSGDLTFESLRGATSTPAAHIRSALACNRAGSPPPCTDLLLRRPQCSQRANGWSTNYRHRMTYYEYEYGDRFDSFSVNHLRLCAPAVMGGASKRSTFTYTWALHTCPYTSSEEQQLRRLMSDMVRRRSCAHEVQW